MSKELAKVDERLRSNMKLGMSHVNPVDIRPPQILLVQKSSDFTMMIDSETNKMAVFGQFFHTGKMKVIPVSFDGYFIFAAEKTYVDKRVLKKEPNNPEKANKLKYSAIGLMADDMSMFAMDFKSTARFALSPLFTAAVSNNRGMYSVKVRIETKKLSGNEGDWYVPVVRVIGFENDPKKLDLLEEYAQRFDQIGLKATEPEEEKTPGTESVASDFEEDMEREKLNQDVDPDSVKI